MRTLNRYILKDLLQTFSLAVIITTALVTLAGGIYNIVRQAGVGPAELFFLLPLLIPIFLYFTVPLGAVFAVTLVYGRFAADNEAMAVRAAGINIVRLFVPALWLGLAVAVFASAMENYAIGYLRTQIEQAIKRNVGPVLESRLRSSGSIELRFGEDRLQITAAMVESNFDDQQLRDLNWDPADTHIGLVRPTILSLNAQGQRQFLVAAEYGFFRFNTRVDPIELTVAAVNARSLDGDRPAAQLELQTFGPFAFDRRFYNPTLLSLDKLIELRDQPWRSPEVLEQIDRIRTRLTRAELLDRAREALSTAGLRLSGAREGVLEIHGTVEPPAEPARPQDLFRVELSDASITRVSATEVEPRDFRAPVVTLRVQTGADQQPQFVLELKSDRGVPVQLSNDASAVFGPPRERDEIAFKNLSVPESWLAERSAPSPQSVVSPEFATRTDVPLLAEAHASLLESIDDLRREIDAQLHRRFGIGLGVVVAVMMAAMLGLIFRGHRVLTAVLISTAPYFTAMAIVVMGNTLAANEGVVGLWLHWGGLLIMGIANLIVMRFGVEK